MDKAVFCRRVAQKLGIVSSTGEFSADDNEVVSGAYASLHALLEDVALTTWTIEEDVPDKVADPLIDMTAATLVDAFGVQDPRRAAIRAEGLYGLPSASPAERRLRKLLAVPPIDSPPNEYF